ncbi:hypothetical protein ILUMI_19321, partial [Ignelater luminosus]
MGSKSPSVSGMSDEKELTLEAGQEFSEWESHAGLAHQSGCLLIEMVGLSVDYISYLVLSLIQSEAKNAFEVAVEEEKSDTEQPRTTTSWGRPSRDSLPKEVHYDEIGHKILRKKTVGGDVAEYVRPIVLLRMVIVTYRNKDFARLIQKIKLFWDPSICDQQTKGELISIRRYTYQLQRLLLVAVSIAMGLGAVVSVVQNTTPTGIWTMEGHEELYRF